MALNLKGLLSRKKKARAAEEGRDEPFFTGSTLGPGLGPDGDDDDAGGETGAAPARDFDDLLDDDAWGGDEDDDGDERPARRGGGGKRIAVFAAIGIGAAALAGGGAWWVMTSGLLDGDHAAEMEQHAEAAPADGAPADEGGSGDAPAAAAAAQPQDSGARVSLPMPPAPGLGGGPQATTATADAQLDPTAATDRSVSRRPWLAEGGDAAATPAAPAEAPKPTEPAQAAAAPAEAPKPAEAAKAAEPAKPAEAAQQQPQQQPAAPQTAAVTTPPADPAAPAPAAQAPAAPALEEVDKPDPRTATAPPPSFDGLPNPTGKPEPLKAAPVSDLVRNTPAGPLPIAAPDGRKAWTTYAKPFQAPAGTPRVAIVVADLGLLPAATDAAIAKLPAGVTLAFSPYGFDLAPAMQRAREAGHEVMLSLPMEDRGFPAHDPGPLGLNSLLPTNDNLIRLNTILTKGTGYVGLLGRGGKTFTAKPELMKPVLDTVARSGLLYVQPAGGVQLASYGQTQAPVVAADFALDERPFRSAIEARLKALETIARERGSALAVIEPTPLAFDAVTKWLADAQTRGIALAPVSAVVRP